MDKDEARRGVRELARAFREEGGEITAHSPTTNEEFERRVRSRRPDIHQYVCKYLKSEVPRVHYTRWAL